jgi:hypothetical protein
MAAEGAGSLNIVLERGPGGPKKRVPVQVVQLAGFFKNTTGIRLDFGREMTICGLSDARSTSPVITGFPAFS